MAGFCLSISMNNNGWPPIKKIVVVVANTGLSISQGSPQKKKSSGRSLKTLNLAREQHNKIFTVVRVCDKKIKDFLIKTQQII